MRSPKKDDDALQVLIAIGQLDGALGQWAQTTACSTEEIKEIQTAAIELRRRIEDLLNA